MCFAAAWRVNPEHTLRFGFTGSGEFAKADNTSTVFPVDANGNVDGSPFTPPGQLDSKVGWLAGVYVQDEWKITKQLTLNTGVRFDQMVGYVDANQFSPRVNLTYKVTPETTFHAGYARYFTPPELSLSRRLRRHDPTSGGPSGRCSSTRKIELLRHRRRPSDRARPNRRYRRLL
jgi:outer membrane receptor protein involved in Fe transport